MLCVSSPKADLQLNIKEDNMMASIEHSINSNNIHYCLRRSNSITVASALADFFPAIFMLCCGGDDTEFIIVGCGENVHNRLSQELHTRCLMVSTDQADPSCFYFRIS